MLPRSWGKFIHCATEVFWGGLAPLFGPRSGTSELMFFRTGPHDCGNRGFPIANDSRLPSENETRAIAQAPRTISTSFRLSFIEIQAAQAVRAAQAARAARAVLAARCTRCCIRLRFADDGKMDLAAASGRTRHLGFPKGQWVFPTERDCKAQGSEGARAKARSRSQEHERKTKRARPSNTIQGKTRHDTTNQDNTRQDKTN